MHRERLKFALIAHPDGKSDALISYAVSEAGALVHVSGVPRGKSCDCRCVACGGSMLAKKGEIRIHHFAHADGVDCVGGFETVLHRLAKEILGNATGILVPGHRWSRKLCVGKSIVRLDRQLFGGGRIYIDAVDIESQQFPGVRPDVLIEWTSLVGARKRILVEIAVRHRVDGEKLRKIQRLGLPALEVLMSSEMASQPLDAVRSKLLHSTAGKQWLYHPAELKAQQEFERRVARAEEDWRRQCTERAAQAQARIRKMMTPLSLPKSRSRSATMKQFLEYEERLAAFKAVHGRLPTLEESRALFSESGANENER